MGQLTKTISIVGIIIVILVISFVYIGARKDATALQVQVQVTGDANKPEIENITAYIEPANKVSLQKSTELLLPGVTVVILHNMTVIGEWTSVPYNGAGVYRLTVGLTKNPKPGDTIKVVARVMDSRSQNLAVSSKEITLP